MSMKNFTDPKDLLVAAMAQIEMHPETWDQEHWRNEADCGTTYCLAGWMATLDGQKWVEGRRRGSLETPGGLRHISDWAYDVLDPQDARDVHALFRGENSLASLRAGVKAYLNDEDIIAAIDDAQVTASWR